MKIAYVTSWADYPPTSGLQEQTWMLIEALVARGHTVDVFGYVRRKPRGVEDRPSQPSSVSVKRRRTPAVVSGLASLVAARLNVRPFRSLAFANYDVIHLEGVAVTPVARLLSRANVPCVASIVDPGSLRYRRMRAASRSLSKRLVYTLASYIHVILEKDCSRHANRVHVVSAEDAEYLRKTYPIATVVAIPVMRKAPDVDREMAVSHSPAATPSSKGVLIYCDLRLDHMRAAATACLDRFVRRAREQGIADTFTLLGRVSATAALQQLANEVQVECVGWVDDSSTVIKDSTFVVIPDTVGTGIKNRTVESLSLGRVVLGLPSAFEGMETEDLGGSPPFIIETSMERLYASWLELRVAESRVEAMQRNAQDFAQQFGVRSVAKRWETLYAELAQTRRQMFNNLRESP